MNNACASVLRIDRGDPVSFPCEEDLEVRVARDESEREAAQRLRFEVFNVELRLGLASSFSCGLDRDAYDAYCDHLLVVDRARGKVAGTYRLLPWDRTPSFGFYSETEFDLDNVKRSGLRLLELGRSCVHPDYRSGRVINLLFQGIAEYAQAHGADALVGCVSLRGNDIEELRAVSTLLRNGFLSDPRLRVTPKRGFDLPGIEDDVPIEPSDVFRKLPPLFKGYLRLGAKTCGPPAFDRQFGTTDYFLLVKTDNVVRRYRRRFFG